MPINQHVVSKSLTHTEGVAAVHAGNRKRAAARPTTEMMLNAFRGLYLIVINVNEVDRYCMTALNAVQTRILGLIGFPPAIYQGIGMQSGKPDVKMGEP
jgi:hypothetical protein